MSNSKKMQQEIDRHIRRTQEGIDSYEKLYDKFARAATQAQKERFEGDLKKEIKKLQRFRDDIKAFIANPEVKDIKDLEKYQRKIEEKMEVFKVCERETKTKAFSKEGLAASSPYETPQARTEAWLKSAMDDARKQIEIIEYDVDKNTRQHTRGKHGASQQSTEAMRLQRLKFNLGKLEQLLKMVTNGYSDLNEVDGIEDDVLKILHNESPANECDQDEVIYSYFDLPEIDPRAHRLSHEGNDEDAAAAAAAPAQPAASASATATPLAAALLSSDQSKKSAAASPAMTKAAVSKTPPSAAVVSGGSGGSGGKAEQRTRLPATPVTQVSPMAQAVTTTTTTTTSTTTPSAAAKPTPSLRDMPAEQWDEASAALLDDDMDTANDDTFGGDAMDMASGPGSLADMAKATVNLMPLGDWEKGRPAALTLPANAKPAAEAATSPAAGGAQPAAATPPSVVPRAAEPQQQKQQRSQASSSGPGGANSNATSAAATVTFNFREDRSKMLSLVDMSLACLPHTQDVDRQRPFEPSNPTTCPAYYPQQMLPALASPDIYGGFDLETLFFIFYYHQSTCQQFYAARQIKAHSFRYHMQLNQWFQRKGVVEETQEWERGSFIYFNYEDTWRMEEKENFTFYYKYLESELR